MEISVNSVCSVARLKRSILPRSVATSARRPKPELLPIRLRQIWLRGLAAGDPEFVFAAGWGGGFASGEDET